jgi:heat shock protein 1/8
VRAGVLRRQDAFEFIPNERGDTATPAYISFLEGGDIVIGEEALYLAESNPKNTVYEFTKLLGKSFDDEAVQSAAKRVPYRIVRNEMNEPAIEVDVGNLKRYSIADLMALLLGRERWLGS